MIGLLRVHNIARKAEGALVVVGALSYLPAGIFIGVPQTRDQSMR